MDDMTKLSPLIQQDPWLKPYSTPLAARQAHTMAYQKRIIGDQSLIDFAGGYLYFGLHKVTDGWTLREWLPGATAVYVIGEFSDWIADERYALVSGDDGVWRITVPPNALHHEDLYKLEVHWPGGSGQRIPAYATRAVQDADTHLFSAQVWNPPQPYVWQRDFTRDVVASPYIYEAHIGMSGENERVSTTREFIDNVLPRIIKAGYNTIQLMAVAEHPYYGSFGYHVSSFFAASSRFGTPEDLKELIDHAHAAGIAVIADIVHSHAVKNESEGLSRQDGTPYQYFHEGVRGDHPAWDSRVFNYSKPQVAHFLLSNCRYWLDEYRFDGYRFDGVTSMLYMHHGLNRDFVSYDDYFTDIDDDAVAYLTLANQLIHEIKPDALTVAEDLSGLPGLAAPIDDDGIGFDYRLSMGIPDRWIKLIKEVPDERWQVSSLLHELTQHRPEEKTISYAESHDQALVGDKTIIFRLADRAMYDSMMVSDDSLVADRAIALHKIIRLLTTGLHQGGYLNFMGNEFGHPEWVDFPRVGNDWSYAYARRQWSLADDPKLKYHWLGAFDQALISLLTDCDGDMQQPVSWTTANDNDQVLGFMRGDLLFVVSLNPETSFTGYPLYAQSGEYRVVLSSDDPTYGGFDRIDIAQRYVATDSTSSSLKLYIPARTCLVLRRTSAES